MATRVLIVDDHGGFRAAARAMLEADGFEVVRVLLDVQLPDVDGFAVAERLSRAARPPRVVLVSSRPAGAYRRQLARASVTGFLAKAELTAGSVAALVR